MAGGSGYFVEMDVTQPPHSRKSVRQSSRAFELPVSDMALETGGNNYADESIDSSHLKSSISVIVEMPPVAPKDFNEVEQTV